MLNDGVHDPVISFIELGRLKLRSATWGPGRPEIVMLHDGLGSIGQWRSVPGAVAERTGRTVLAYERAGHGKSRPVPAGPWPLDWLEREADVLEHVLAKLAGPRSVLVGHSDGGTAALLLASRPNSSVSAVLAIAPHSFVEQVCLDAIHDMRDKSGAIVMGLARHHDAPAALFDAWSGAWVSPDFRQWDIRGQLGAIDIPAMIAQGSLDAYATAAHPVQTADAIGANATARIVPDVGHIMHHDDAEMVVTLISDFVRDHSERRLS